MDPSWLEILKNHWGQIQYEEDLFVTTSGYFGRCPKGVAKKGHQVAIIGGAWRPFLLAKQAQGHYHFVCHAYVPGIMDLKKLTPDMEVTRIELE